ncbi:hypothetical protein WJ0W_006552 [Paenibacillus melissococcoides]|uniref:Uncharacterized protein n=1 Tax=Paenibacillus melissococcoides TaxID=2912268 RepID=A0ABN8UIC2_9BACL|nr:MULTISPECIES: hypothetical protein [Paenibacillus]MEB9892678.1 hypothetical protein [Bacillus cereus]CAH8249366.1 hypothetical protein WJ0W_006552 [Paenibacillus melissococcoides]CAH8721252.1 hypothetical protein WDD9_006202 [Paenibacillus melissococcoides]CAH8721584.1 hypothetical protein HTL2_006432 [Paenibacillus melissococcoides]GIO81905.1 hypothetical protein J6TS7_55150 [Paenibacillus dendritiformis]
MSKQQTVTIEQEEYVLQHPGARALMRLYDVALKADGGWKLEPSMDFFLQHVIVAPRLSWEALEEKTDIMTPLWLECARFLSMVDTPLESESSDV